MLSGKPVYILLRNGKRAVNITAKISPRIFDQKVRRIIGEKSAEKNRELVNVLVPRIKRPFALRLGTSDVPTFFQIFVRGDYDFDLPIKPKNIIDGGAHIGLAAVFFANRFPKAKIISIEPEKCNFQMLKRNAKGYRKIVPLRRALWSKQEKLSIFDPDCGNWTFQVRRAKNSNYVRGITISDIAKKYKFKDIDILKLDIEGVEKELFRKNCKGWLPKVKILIIELHDRFKKGCSQVFNKAIQEYDFKKTRRGENIILIKNP